MHDDATMVEARLNRVLNEKIRPAMRSDRRRLDVWAWEVPGEPVAVDQALAATYVPFSVGSMWGRPWGTTWFKMSGAVPQGWAGKRVEAAIDLGFTNMPGFQSEGLMWHQRDGVWVPWRGLHPFNHEVAVAGSAKGGETISYLVEAAANPMLVAHQPDANSDVLTAGQGPIYSLNRAELVVVETDVTELREDVRCLSELMRQLSGDDPRRHEILRALERMLDELVLDDVAGTAGRARAHLAEVLSRPAHASAHRLTAVGHAHLDSAWLWPLRETKRKAARTFANVLDLMADYPELVFACSQAAQYEWMKEEYPSVFEGIIEKVAEGRWVPVGGMWVEPDVNLPSGESLVRQLTFGQRFFEEHFGIRSTEVWIPDVFGYTAALPQLMRLAGISRFLTQKLSWNKTNKFPHHSFWWEGIDGSTVFTHFPPVDSYGALFWPMQLSHAVRNFSDKGRATRSLLPFGFGDGGGGPNRQMMRQFRRVRDLEGLPRIEIGTPEHFFDEAIDEYRDAPRWVGELYFETHRGTYTSQAKTKKGNRRCEQLLHEAELWCVAAYGTKAADGYPKVELDRIWKAVLLNQFHDILPGSSIAWVHREAEQTYAALVADLEEIIHSALSHMAVAVGGHGPAVGTAAPSGARTSGRGSGMPLVANASPFHRCEVVLIDAKALAGADASALVRQDLADGRTALRLSAGAMTLGPAVEPDDEASVRLVSALADGGGIVMGNELISVSIDRDGLLSSVVALGGREGDREVLADGARANLLQLHPDFPTEYDAWDLDEYYRRQVIDLVDASEVQVLDEGPLVASVAVTRSFRSSEVRQVYELRAGSPRLDIHTTIGWHERDHVLKASFPLGIHTDELTREIQFGNVTTKIHTNTSWDAARFEVCAHRWVYAGEADFGAALLNDGKYGHDATRTRNCKDLPSTTVRLTLLKGARYPDPLADEGEHCFTYSLMPTHKGLTDVIEQGYALNMPLRVLPEREVAGAERGLSEQTDPAECAVTGCPVSLAPSESTAVIETVKPADDDSGDLVVRLYESRGCHARSSFVFDTSPVSVSVVDLLEEPNAAIPDAPVAIHGDRVTVDLRPFQVVTLRVVR